MFKSCSVIRSDFPIRNVPGMRFIKAYAALREILKRRCTSAVVSTALLSFLSVINRLQKRAHAYAYRIG